MYSKNPMLHLRVGARVRVGIIIVLGCPILKLRFLDALEVGIFLIEVPCYLLGAFVTGEIVAVSVADHVMGEILTTRIARHKLLSFVVHKLILAPVRGIIKVFTVFFDGIPNFILAHLTHSRDLVLFHGEVIGE